MQFCYSLWMEIGRLKKHGEIGFMMSDFPHHSVHQVIEGWTTFSRHLSATREEGER
jgi:hypothetical protein